MAFLYPSFLFGLFAVAIPIIIHLFHFRRFKKVYFTNVRFIQEVKEETSSRNKLRQWLILLARILAITFLVFAFAQPYIPSKGQSASNRVEVVSIFVDNSFSMEGEGESAILFEKARDIASAVCSSFDREVQFQLITHDLEGKHQRLVSQDQFQSMLDELSISPATNELVEIQSRMSDAIADGGYTSGKLFFISDFQKSHGLPVSDTGSAINLIPVQSVNKQNVYIDTVWFQEPIQLLNQPNALVVKLINVGDRNFIDQPLNLIINSESKPGSFSVEANSSSLDTVYFTATKSGWNEAQISLEDFPITFDDSYFISFKVLEQINICAINEEEPSPYLNAIFGDPESFTLINQSLGQLDYSILENVELIILNDLRSIPSGLIAKLESFTKEGGNLIIFPNLEIEPSGYQDLSNALGANAYTFLRSEQQEVAFINTDESVFKDVFERIPQNMDYPQAIQYYNMTEDPGKGEEQILALKDGKSFLSKYVSGRGVVYLSAVALNQESSTLPLHAIFVPMMYKIAILGARGGEIAYTLGDQNSILITDAEISGDVPFKLVMGDDEFIPQQQSSSNGIRIWLQGPDKGGPATAGIYQLKQENSGYSSLVALNYSRNESQIQVFDLEELTDYAEEIQAEIIASDNVAEIRNTVEQLDQGQSLWKLCLILALLFLGLEILLLRLKPST